MPVDKVLEALEASLGLVVELELWLVVLLASALEAIQTLAWRALTT